MSGCSQPPLAVKPLCFSLALPSVPSSSPNPFQLVVLSNFTQSSRSLSRKRGIWPPSPANYSLFLSPSSSSDHRSTALWPALARNYEGYFQHCNLKNTWYYTQMLTHTHTQNYALSKIHRHRGWIKRYTKTGEECLRPRHVSLTSTITAGIRSACFH